MFNQTQIESYKSISAPADLKSKVFEACRENKATSYGSYRKAAYRLAPIAACLVLCFSLFSLTFRSDHQPFYLTMGEIALGSDETPLPSPVQESAVTLVRTISLEPSPYTITLQTSPKAQILSADGDTWLDEEGNLTWTVLIPQEDAVFELTLQSGDETYLVPLTYHLQDGSITIRCQKQ